MPPCLGRRAVTWASVVIGGHLLRVATPGPEGDRLVDDVAVAQEHDPVGPRGELRVVGHDHTGDAPLQSRRGAGA